MRGGDDTASVRRAPVVVLTGPTGTGKTAVALELAASLGAEIVCADSRQIYRGLDVATGKPTREERARVPHHGFERLDPTERASAGEYARATRGVLDGLAARGTTALLVGGTGLYLRALHAGIADVPAVDAAVRTRVRARLDAEGPAALHAELATLDPGLAARLAPGDGQRIARGLEVALATGRPLSSWHAAAAAGEPPRWLWIALERPREILREALASRARGFFRDGLVEEVRALLERGVPATAPAFDALGYREAIDVIAGRLTTDEACERLVLHTVQYAKRQRTWLRGEARRVAIEEREIGVHESPGQIARDLKLRAERFARQGNDVDAIEGHGHPTTTRAGITQR